MNKQPQFSIITICYNSSATIERTIKSVLAQTFTDYEYVIVDGGSKDSTLDIVKKYEPLFEGRMKWKSEPDTGIYDAMNKGIERSSGTIIGIVNSDDWLEADALEVLVEVLKNDPSLIHSILTGETRFHYKDGTTLHYRTSRANYEHYSRKYRMGLNHPATFVPKEIYDEIGMFDTRFRLYGDSDFILRCYDNNVKVHFINKVLSNMADGGASNTRSRAEITDSILKYRKHINNKTVLRYYCAKCILMWCIRIIIPYSFVRYYRKHKKL